MGEVGGDALSSPDAAAARRAFAEPEGAPPVGEGSPGAGLPRVADLLIAASALLVVSPLLLVAALLIRLDSRGTVLYKQLRVGRGGSEFPLYKLRTMRPGSDPVGVGTAVDREDPRVTRVGRLLRRFSLDELPNLVNVLRGEMAIVGPRPTIPSQVELFSHRQHRRHAVRPGMTGWAQINGRIGIEWGERIELDIYYVEHRSLSLDLRILDRTVRLVLSGRGLYTGG